MFGVQLDRLDHQIECVHAVHLACHTVGTAWREAEAFGEVEQTIHTFGVVVEHDQHRTRGVFYAREQQQMIGAEVEHGIIRGTEGAGAAKPPLASAAPLWG